MKKANNEQTVIKLIPGKLSTCQHLDKDRKYCRKYDMYYTDGYTGISQYNWEHCCPWDGNCDTFFF